MSIDPEFGSSEPLEICSRYGGLLLTCNEETFARISTHILTDPSVIEKITNSHEHANLRFISIRMPPVKEPSPRFGWLTLIPTIVASGFSGVVFLVGIVTIAQWMTRLIASR